MMIRHLLSLLCLLLAPAAHAGDLVMARVIKVFDGDSFVVRLNTGGDAEIRLADIDAPEKTQPHAPESRTALRDLILNREIALNVVDIDPYKRKVCYAYLSRSKLYVNAEMVKRGHAWVYRRWVRDESLIDLEQQAKASRRGLWALPESRQTPPWKWRQEHPPTRTPSREPRPAASESTG